MAFNLQDQMLRAYIDKIFDKYDTDQSGTLDQDELTFFFNDLFRELGIGMSVNKEQSLQAIKSIDQNSDGSVDKKELFDAFRKMMSKSQIPQQPQMMNTSYNQPQQPYNQPYQPYNQPYSPPPYNNPYQPVYHNPYNMPNPYTSPPPQYNPYNNNPYNNPPPSQQPYNPYNSQQQSYGGYNGYMGGSMSSSTGNRWGRMQ